MILKIDDHADDQRIELESTDQLVQLLEEWLPQSATLTLLDGRGTSMSAHAINDTHGQEYQLSYSRSAEGSKEENSSDETSGVENLQGLLNTIDSWDWNRAIRSCSFAEAVERFRQFHHQDPLWKDGIEWESFQDGTRKMRYVARLAEVSALGLLLALIVMCGGGFYFGGLALICGVLAILLLRKERLWLASSFVLMQYASIILNAVWRMEIQ